MSSFFLYVLLLSFSLKAQEIQPTWAIRYSPLHLAYQDPTVQFQFEKFVSPQNSWTVSLGLGLRHARNRNQGLDSTQPFDRPFTSFNRSEGNFTNLSPLLGICIGIGRWKK